MLRSATIAALFASGSLLCTSGAFAASEMTEAFVANVRPNVNFLDDASRLALKKSPSARIRAFAHREAMQQTIAANSLVAWTQTNTPRGEAVATGAPLPSTQPGDLGPFAPIGTLAAAPLTVAGDMTGNVVSGVDTLLSGRSVGIDRPLTVRPTPDEVRPAPTLGGHLLPSDRGDMERLSSMDGRAFDALYRSTQRDSLRQLATLYRSYEANGDDPALRAMASKELPKISARLAELGRL